MDIEAFRYKTPKANYLPHNIDADEPVVEEYNTSLGHADPLENAIYFNKIKRAAQKYGIVNPKDCSAGK